MKQARYKKNVVACASNMLKLIMAMLKDKHTYQYRDKSVEELKQLEEKYQEFKNKKKIKKSA